MTTPSQRFFARRGTLAAFTLASLVLGACATSSSDANDSGNHPTSTSQSRLNTVLHSRTLRVLVHKPPQAPLPEVGSPSDRELALAGLFANSLGVKLQIVGVASRKDLIPALLAGRGDLISSRLTITKARKKSVRFSLPVRAVQEWAVVQKDARDYPHSVEQLRQGPVWARRSSSHIESLREAVAQRIAVRFLPENLDPDEILYRVGQGEYGVTILDSDVVESYLSYRDDVKRAFVLHDSVPIAWAFAPDAPKLLTKANHFLREQHLNYKRRYVFKGDLAQIKKRGLLRVILPNNASSYFLYRGQPLGFQLERAEHFAKALGVRLDVVVPRHAADMLPLLLQGHADLIGAALSVTQERQKQIAFSDALMFVDEILVQRAGSTPIEKESQLVGKTIWVRRSSSYWSTLQALQKRIPTLHLKEADDALQTEQLLSQVGRGDIEFTVSDSNLLAIELAFRDDVQAGMVLRKGRPLAFGMRKEDTALLQAVDTFVHDERALLAEKDPSFRDDTASKANAKVPKTPPGDLSPWDALAKQAGQDHEVDWRLIVAQMREESGFDPQAQTFNGGGGLLGVLPRDAKAMGLSLQDPTQGVQAGTTLLARELFRFAAVPDDTRPLFALAAYRVGAGHVRDAQRLAIEAGEDATDWTAVSSWLRRLEQPQIARHTHFGYCRGSDAVAYAAAVSARYARFSSQDASKDASRDASAQ